MLDIQAENSHGNWFTRKGMHLSPKPWSGKNSLKNKKAKTGSFSLFQIVQLVRMPVPSIGKVAGSSSPGKSGTGCPFRKSLGKPRLFLYMAYYIYILESERDGTYYIGSSQDPGTRLAKHNRPHAGYTGRKQPWKLVYTERYASKPEALVREKFIKKQKSKNWILQRISDSSVGL